MKIVSIRAQDKELAAWRKAAESAGTKIGTKLSLSQWIRGRLNEAATETQNKRQK